MDKIKVRVRDKLGGCIPNAVGSWHAIARRLGRSAWHQRFLCNAKRGEGHRQVLWDHQWAKPAEQQLSMLSKRSVQAASPQMSLARFANLATELWQDSGMENLDARAIAALWSPVLTGTGSEAWEAGLVLRCWRHRAWWQGAGRLCPHRDQGRSASQHVATCRAVAIKSHSHCEVKPLQRSKVAEPGSKLEEAQGRKP